MDESDAGARDRGLWPGVPILVAPCDRFVGAGYYQFTLGRSMVIGHAFRLNAKEVRVAQMMRSGGYNFADFTHKMFDDAVCGLVLASLDVVCSRLVAELYRSRKVLT